MRTSGVLFVAICMLFGCAASNDPAADNGSVEAKSSSAQENSGKSHVNLGKLELHLGTASYTLTNWQGVVTPDGNGSLIQLGASNDDESARANLSLHDDDPPDALQFSRAYSLSTVNRMTVNIGSKTYLSTDGSVSELAFEANTIAGQIAATLKPVDGSESEALTGSFAGKLVAGSGSSGNATLSR